MAKAQGSKRRPRIRKSAPTIRERAEAVKSKTENPKKRPIRSLASKAAAPAKRLGSSNKQPVKSFKKVLGGIKGVLRWMVPKYFVNSWREIRQVQWPNRRETWRLTLAVFIFAIIFGSLVAGVDKVLDEIFKKVVLK